MAQRNYLWTKKNRIESKEVKSSSGLHEKSSETIRSLVWCRKGEKLVVKRKKASKIGNGKSNRYIYYVVREDELKTHHHSKMAGWEYLHIFICPGWRMERLWHKYVIKTLRKHLFLFQSEYSMITLFLSVTLWASHRSQASHVFCTENVRRFFKSSPELFPFTDKQSKKMRQLWNK